MSEKKYLDYEGLSLVATKVNSKLQTVTTMPSEPTDGTTVVFTGTNPSYITGHIYQFKTSGFTQNWYCYEADGYGYFYVQDNPISSESTVYVSDGEVPPESESDLSELSGATVSVTGGRVPEIYLSYDGDEYLSSHYSAFDLAAGGSWFDLSKSIPEYAALGSDAPDYFATIRQYRPQEPFFIISGGPYGDGAYVSNVTKAFGCYINDGSGRNDLDVWAVYDGTVTHVISLELYHQSWTHNTYDVANPVIEDNLLFKDSLYGGIANLADNTTIITSPEREDNEFAAGAIVHIYPANDNTFAQISTEGTGLYVKQYCSVGDIIYKGYDYSSDARLIGFGIITENTGGNYTWVDRSGNTNTFTSSDKQTPEHRYAVAVGSIPSMRLSTSYGSQDWYFTTLYLGKTTENFTTGHTYRREYESGSFYWKDISSAEDTIAREMSAAAMANATVAYNAAKGNIKSVESMPLHPEDKDIFLYTGDPLGMFKTGRIYQFHYVDPSEAGSTWFCYRDNSEAPHYYYTYFPVEIPSVGDHVYSSKQSGEIKVTDPEDLEQSEQTVAGVGDGYITIQEYTYTRAPEDDIGGTSYWTDITQEMLEPVLNTVNNSIKTVEDNAAKQFQFGSLPAPTYDLVGRTIQVVGSSSSSASTDGTFYKFIGENGAVIETLNDLKTYIQTYGKQFSFVDEYRPQQWVDYHGKYIMIDGKQLTYAYEGGAGQSYWNKVYAFATLTPITHFAKQQYATPAGGVLVADDTAAANLNVTGYSTITSVQVGPKGIPSADINALFDD